MITKMLMTIIIMILYNKIVIEIHQILEVCKKYHLIIQTSFKTILLIITKLNKLILKHL